MLEKHKKNKTHLNNETLILLCDDMLYSYDSYTTTIMTGIYCHMLIIQNYKQFVYL